MNVLLTGANGFIGRVTARLLTIQGFTVTAVVRQPSTEPITAKRTLVIQDPHASTEWIRALTGIDAVVHLAAVTHDIDGVKTLADYRRTNVEVTKVLALAAASCGVRRFVYMSSIKVNGEFSPHNSDGSFAALSAADEPQPTTHYGITKWEAEMELTQIAERSSLAVVALRPPLVFGPAQRANMLRLMRAVDRRIPLPLARLRSPRSLIYVENLAGAVLCALRGATTGARAYTLADIDITVAELVDEIGRALDKKARLFALPETLLRTASRLLGRTEEYNKLAMPLIVERQSIAQEIGWTPHCTFEQSLATTATWYLGSEQR